MKKVLINYGKGRDADFLVKCREVEKGMTGNAYFPSPVPTIADFSKTVDDFDNAIPNAKTGDRNAVAKKNVLRLNLESMMRDLAMYVNLVSKGDIEKLTSSAFTLSKKPEPTHVPIPEILGVSQGLNPGTLIVKKRSYKGVKGFLYQVAPDPLTDKTEWTTVASSRVKYEFDNLEQGKLYWFRIVAIGSNDQLVYSNTLSQYVIQRTQLMAA